MNLLATLEYGLSLELTKETLHVGQNLERERGIARETQEDVNGVCISWCILNDAPN